MTPPLHGEPKVAWRINQDCEIHEGVAVDHLAPHRPASALDIRGMDRATDVLRCDKLQDRHLAGLGVDFDIAELAREAGRHATRH